MTGTASFDCAPPNCGGAPLRMLTFTPQAPQQRLRRLLRSAQMLALRRGLLPASDALFRSALLLRVAEDDVSPLAGGALVGDRYAEDIRYRHGWCTAWIERQSCFGHGPGALDNIYLNRAVAGIGSAGGESPVAITFSTASRELDRPWPIVAQVHADAILW